jgi:hypothetical protein
MEDRRPARLSASGGSGFHHASEMVDDSQAEHRPRE